MSEGQGLRAQLGDAVHLCLDMQGLFATGGAWAAPWVEIVLPRIERLVAHCPARTVFTRFLPPAPDEETPGMWSAYWRKWSHVRRGAI